ncbi:MAG: DNA repair protein RadC [Rhodothermales bacterium]|nr:DNA repair protein RadC [Rhodothermales bacterium]
MSNQDKPDQEVSDYRAPIRSWHVEDRPREKLFRHGAGILSDAELIAIVFGSGTKTRHRSYSAVELGRSLIRDFGSLRGIARRDFKQLTRAAGIGQAKAARLHAVFEIGRRIESAREGSRTQVYGPDDIAGLYGPFMRDLKNEIFRIVLLNTSNVILADRVISEGGLAASIVEPRAVFREAILENAAGIVCLHNHPSENPEPSREDIRVTCQLVEAGRMIGIPVHDHIIIAGHRYTSLAERGLLPE